jgi:hypothetical protein
VGDEFEAVDRRGRSGGSAAGSDDAVARPLDACEQLGRLRPSDFVDTGRECAVLVVSLRDSMELLDVRLDDEALQ